MTHFDFELNCLRIRNHVLLQYSKSKHDRFLLKFASDVSNGHSTANLSNLSTPRKFAIFGEFEYSPKWPFWKKCDSPRHIRTSNERVTQIWGEWPLLNLMSILPFFVQGSNSCSEDHQERGQISRGCKTWGQCPRKNSGKRSK